jgi:serine/threonine kinase 32
MGNINSKPPPKPVDYGPQVTMDLLKFKLISPLGKGTFCKVMAVEDTHTGGILAMKYCNKERLHEKKAINHILQERNLLERINHPYISNMLYSFQDTQFVYMVLELMSGGDLRLYMTGPMPEVFLDPYHSYSQEGCRIIMAEVCLALEYLHNNNIVHRDIKPDVY